MFHLNICNIMRSTEKQYLQKNIVAIIFHNFIPHIFAATPETAHLDILRAIQKMPQKISADGSCDILHHGKFSLFKYTEYDIISFFDLRKELRDL